MAHFFHAVCCDIINDEYVRCAIKNQTGKIMIGNHSPLSKCYACDSIQDYQAKNELRRELLRVKINKVKKQKFIENKRQIKLNEHTVSNNDLQRYKTINASNNFDAALATAANL